MFGPTRDEIFKDIHPEMRRRLLRDEFGTNAKIRLSEREPSTEILHESVAEAVQAVDEARQRRMQLAKRPSTYFDDPWDFLTVMVYRKALPYNLGIPTYLLMQLRRAQTEDRKVNNWSNNRNQAIVGLYEEMADRVETDTTLDRSGQVDPEDPGFMTAERFGRKYGPVVVKGHRLYKLIGPRPEPTSDTDLLVTRWDVAFATMIAAAHYGKFSRNEKARPLVEAAVHRLPGR